MGLLKQQSSQIFNHCATLNMADTSRHSPLYLFNGDLQSPCLSLPLTPLIFFNRPSRLLRCLCLLEPMSVCEVHHQTYLCLNDKICWSHWHHHDDALKYVWWWLQAGPTDRWWDAPCVSPPPPASWAVWCLLVAIDNGNTVPWSIRH